MDLKEIKQIIDLMKRSELTEFEIEEQGLKLRICRDSGAVRYGNNGDSQPPFVPVPVAAPAAAAEAPSAAPAAAPAESAKDVAIIKSPMVGTFYRSPSPDSPVFVNVGSVVGPESVVCIIEAMKVMNEIQAEIAGRILEVLVENGATVEYGQPLFKVKQG